MKSKHKKKTIEEIVEYNENFVKKTIDEAGKIEPMIVFSKNGQIICGALFVQRPAMREILKKIRSKNPDWVVFMFEAYYRKYKEEPSEDFENGNLEKSYNMGDPTVKLAVVLQIYCGDKKRVITYDRNENRLTNRMEAKEFSGYMDDMSDDYDVREG
jgi:hypothetical protein